MSSASADPRASFISCWSLTLLFYLCAVSTPNKPLPTVLPPFVDLFRKIQWLDDLDSVAYNP
jgi:hypothetical protein